MTLVCGIDPGNHGAFVVVNDQDGRIVLVEDMPLWWQMMGKRKRPRIDAAAIAEIFDRLNMIGVELAVMEGIGGRPLQSASSAFVLGYGVGMIYMACIIARIPLETTPAATWKKLMRVPGKKEADDTAILARADEMFPHDRGLFRGPKGGKLIDRAEAGMIGLFGCHHILRTMSAITNLEARMVYRIADTGA